jgi:hypothetical protein
MAMMAKTWTLTIRSNGDALGVGLDAETGTITHITDGAFSQVDRQVREMVFSTQEEAEFGYIELGDRITEVDGEVVSGGNAQDLLSARLSPDGKLFGELCVTLLRPRLVQPLVVQMQPGEQLGLDVEITATNIIQSIDAGLVADLNKVYPGSIAVGDRILEVDGVAGNAVQQIRAWAKDHLDAPGDLHFKVARSACHASPNFEGMHTGAWNFSLMVRVAPGESLGVGINIEDNTITDIDDSGAIANLNNAHPRAVQVGDTILSVDGIPCPKMNSSAELESWFKGRTLYSKDIPRDMRLTVLRPVQLAADVTVLPPYEYALVGDFGSRVEAKAESKSTAAPSKEGSDDGQSAGTTSTTDLPAGAAGTKLPHPAQTLTKPISLNKFVDSTVVAAPEPRRWYQIFNGQCCAPSNSDVGEQRIDVVRVSEDAA